MWDVPGATDPVVYRNRGLAVASSLAAAVVVWFGASAAWLHPTMVTAAWCSVLVAASLGVLYAWGIGPRVEVDSRGLLVVNPLGRAWLGWDEVDSVEVASTAGGAKLVGVRTRAGLLVAMRGTVEMNFSGQVGPRCRRIAAELSTRLHRSRGN